jgi:hypothetical protein
MYCRVYEVNLMRDPEWLRQRYEVLRKCVKVSKIYLETHRDMVVADEQTVRQAKEFFESRGIQTAGGITVTVNEPNRFETYCYTNPEHRQKLKEVVALTARLFDEVILDDFFFTNCKCESCIAAKGDKSWTEFRLELMTAAARELVIEPAKAVNPNVKLVIKYPNWYEHFQGLGFNLETEPQMFDGIYTGTETRDPVMSNQHIQPYHGYSIMRYFENIAPGRNGGGWVDPFGSRYADRYAEQLWLTLFAKTPEVTLFDFRVLDRLTQDADRAPWQDGGPVGGGPGVRLDFDAATQPFRLPDGSLQPDASYVLFAGAAFEQADSVYARLGNPIGVASYKPFHSHGEDFLHSYLGMLGIPVELSPNFPSEAQTILLTEAARFDPHIVEKIKTQLCQGKTVVITSGLLSALQGKGIEEIVELQTSDRKLTTNQFLIGWNRMITSEQPVTVPQIGYLTNDSWEEISCNAGVSGSPLLLSAQYAKGLLYVLTIPDAFSDLYRLPREVLNRIREVLSRGLPVHLDAPGEVALFIYDNNTMIVESFLSESTQVKIVVGSEIKGISDALTSESLTAGEEILDWRGRPTGKCTFSLALAPHSFRVLEISHQ